MFLLVIVRAVLMSSARWGPSRWISFSVTRPDGLVSPVTLRYKPRREYALNQGSRVALSATSQNVGDEIFVCQSPASISCVADLILEILTLDEAVGNCSLELPRDVLKSHLEDLHDGFPFQMICQESCHHPRRIHLYQDNSRRHGWTLKA